MVNYDYLYDLNAFAEDVNVDHFTNKVLSYQVVENGYILPFKNIEGKFGGGVVNSNKEYLQETSLHCGRGCGYEFDDESVRKSDETVVYLGAFHKIWGHCITDNIRRMWFLVSDYFRQFRECKIIYVPLADFSMGANFLELLSIIGIDGDSFIALSEITRYSRIIIPDECFYSNEFGTRLYTREYIDIVDSVRSYATNHLKEDQRFRRIYFSHSKHSGINQIGEKKLEKFFKLQGYTIIHPEEYTFKQQINMLANCDFFASTVGSCSHNIMFLPDGASVILIPRANFFTGYQLAIDTLGEKNIYYVDSNLSIYVSNKMPWTGPYYFYVSQKLMDFFDISAEEQVNIWKKNLKDFKVYELIGTNKYSLSTRYLPAIYYQVLMESLDTYHKSHRYSIIECKYNLVVGFVKSLFL